jgi:hypothetical protein
MGRGRSIADRRSITDLSHYLLSVYLPKVVSRVVATLRNREHQLARILSAVIMRRVVDSEAEAFKQIPAIQARRIFNLQKTSRQIRSPTPSCLLTQPLVIQGAL